MYNHDLYPQVLCVFVLIRNNLQRQIPRQKNMITALNKNMPPGSFSVLNFPFIKKAVKHLQNERVKKRYQQITFVKKN